MKTSLMERGYRPLIVLANREPIAHEWTVDRQIVAKRSTSGLVRASEALVRAYGGVWVAHGSGTADRETVEVHDGLVVPPEDPRYRLRRVWLDEAEVRGYYDGFANEGLWPLCHRVHIRPQFRSSDFDAYWAVNERFVDAVVEEAAGEAATVIVQDYHFALAPTLLRERDSRHAIVAFWHIPWPAVDRLSMCPWATYLLEGLLGATVVGFQTTADAMRFLDAAEHLLGAAVDRKRRVATYRNVTAHVRVYPASVEADADAAPEQEPADATRRELCARLGLDPALKLIVGVDRLDYTKGLEEKMLAIESLLAQCPEYLGRVAFVQVAQPSRSRLPAYQELRRQVMGVANRVNARFATRHWRPVHFLVEHWEPPVVKTLLRGADICYVGSLHDGMNLVAKEFVSARHDEDGVLVLSTFCGAADELTDALLVNPYDVEGTAARLKDALSMSREDRRMRMRRLRARVSSWTSAHWCDQVMSDGHTLCPPVTPAGCPAPTMGNTIAECLTKI